MQTKCSITCYSQMNTSNILCSSRENACDKTMTMLFIFSAAVQTMGILLCLTKKSPYKCNQFVKRTWKFSVAYWTEFVFNLNMLKENETVKHQIN